MAKLTPTLGIIVCRVQRSRPPHFYERHYFHQLISAGKKHGLSVWVFDPRQVDWDTRTVLAWQAPSSQDWISKRIPLPPLIYDRCYYSNTAQYLQYKHAVKQLADDPQIQFLGKPLSGKYQTYQIMNTNRHIAPYLPDTRRYQSIHDVKTMLDLHGSICLKPNGGSHGRGVIAILPESSSWVVKGRNLENQPLRLRSANHEKILTWCDQLAKQNRYIIQPYLSLSTKDGVPFDLRMLIQKDEQNEWQITGVAIRTGNPISITSNLHGGGQASTWEQFLPKHFPVAIHQNVQQQIEQCAMLVPKHIEQNYGNLVELGLDMGIDQTGKVWILEVNSKPGRSVFVRTKQWKTFQNAIERPIRYAKSILQRTKEVHMR